MSGIGDRFRRATAGVADALGLRRPPGGELVRVDQPELPASPPPRPPRALPAPEHPLCRACGQRHPRTPSPFGGGLAAAYGRTILPDPDRPAPLGRGVVNPRLLLRDQVNPWRHGTPDPPPPSLDLAQLREELYAPRIPWWEQREH